MAEKREESQTTVLAEENQTSIAKENQTGINAEKSQASIPENQLKWQEFTKKKSSLNHCVWNTIFYNRKALTGFWRSCLPKRLNFCFRLSISVVDCRRHILPSCMVAGKSKIFIE